MLRRDPIIRSMRCDNRENCVTTQINSGTCLMRVILASSVMLGIGLGLPAQASVDTISGVWQRGDGKATVRIARCGASVCAVNTWVSGSASGEKVGDRLIMTVSLKSDQVLSGTAFDPQRNLSYRIEIKFASQSMTTKGCVLGGLICKAVGWSRIS